MPADAHHSHEILGVVPDLTVPGGKAVAPVDIFAAYPPAPARTASGDLLPNAAWSPADAIAALAPPHESGLAMAMSCPSLEVSPEPPPRAIASASLATPPIELAGHRQPPDETGVIRITVPGNAGESRPAFLDRVRRRTAVRVPPPRSFECEGERVSPDDTPGRVRRSLRPEVIRWCCRGLVASLLGIVVWSSAGVVADGWPGRLDKTPSAVAALPASVGSVRVSTQPDGAVVWCDGVERGVSPVVLDALVPGRHDITVQGASGRVQTTVSIRAGETQDVLVPIYSGWLAPFAAVELTVRHQGHVLGTTQSGRIMVPPGRYTLDVESEMLGFRTTADVTVRPGEVTPVNVALPAVSLQVNAPDGATIWVDDELRGTAPLGPLTVPAGTRLVTVRQSGVPDQRAVVIVGYRGTAHLTIVPAR